MQHDTGATEADKTTYSAGDVDTSSCDSRLAFGELPHDTGGTEVSAVVTYSHGDVASRLSFIDLPPEVKLHVFALLTATERGVAAAVCRDWRALMRVATLWSDIDTTTLPTCPLTHQHTGACRAAQNRRCCQFLDHVASARAVIRRLCISGDICSADWRGALQSFLVNVRLHELSSAHIDWAANGAGDVAEKRNEKARRAQRLFVGIFDTFTRVAPKVTTLILPFDWSERSIQMLLRLSHLNTLVLKKYFVYQCLSQSMLNHILDGLPVLRRLHLEVWIASGLGAVSLSISSRQLEFLDLSQCRGLELERVNLPQLAVIKLNRLYPWHGSLMLRNPTSSADQCRPCIREVLACGAPQLRLVNEHILRPEWSDLSGFYDELNLVIGAVCSCPCHQSDSWIS